MLTKIINKSHIINIAIPCDLCGKYKAVKKFEITCDDPFKIRGLNVKFNISSYYRENKNNYIYSIRLCSDECLEYVKLVLC